MVDAEMHCFFKFLIYFLLAYDDIQSHKHKEEKMELKERCQRFLDELGVPVTVFSSKVSLSPRALYDWKNDKLKLSDASLKRIDDYLTKYGF